MNLIDRKNKDQALLIFAVAVGLIALALKLGVTLCSS